MVHGTMDRGGSFRRVAAQLADCTVITYDRRGYAGSVDTKPSAAFASHVDDLFDVLGARTAVGVGHSLGGDVVLAAAQQRPDLIDAAVVFEPPQPWVESWAAHSAGAALDSQGERTPERAAEAFMRRMVGDDVWERLPAATRRQRLAEGEALVADLRSIRGGQPVFDPEAITIPVILGHGTRSRRHHREGTRLLAGLLSRGELVAIEGSGHGAHLSHPVEFAALVRRALAKRNGPVESRDT
jgi:pimeloyl-ACP methyl ester carboxylesterase